MIKWLVVWLIAKYLPGYHLSKNPGKRKGVNHDITDVA